MGKPSPSRDSNATVLRHGAWPKGISFKTLWCKRKTTFSRVSEVRFFSLRIICFGGWGVTVVHSILAFPTRSIGWKVLEFFCCFYPNRSWECAMCCIGRCAVKSIRILLRVSTSTPIFFEGNTHTKTTKKLLSTPGHRWFLEDIFWLTTATFSETIKRRICSSIRSFTRLKFLGVKLPDLRV